MINLRIPPKNPEELYEFFMNIARSPVKSHVAYVGGIQYIREDWVVNTFLARKSEYYQIWFHYKESDPPRWYEVYQRYEQPQENYYASLKYT